MIWENSEEELYKFVKMLNTHHPSFTVKVELSSESMNFLDTVVYKENRFKETGTFDTKVYFKTNRYFGTAIQEIISPKPYY